MPTTLPTPLTTFVGRRTEVGEIRRAFGTTRLLTLTGPGGAGKTRLALRAAEQMRRQHQDGVAFVALDSLVDCDSDLLLETVSRTLGLSQASGDSYSVIAEFLSTRHVLLVLDGCEHLLRVCVPLVEKLLADAPALRVLATSREVFNSTSEQVLRIEPFPVPGATSFEEAKVLDVVRLFEQRASESVRDFTLTDQNWAQVLDICARLDGLPLAVELAVRWLRTLPLDQLAARLADTLDLLSPSTNGKTDRLRTMTGAVSWSYDLVSPAEQALWARLSYFSGEPDLAAIRATCTGGLVAPGDVGVLLDRLVDKSVVSREERDGVARYHMLDVIRRFGREKLRCREEYDQVANRHLEYYAELARRSEREWSSGATQQEVHLRLRDEHEDLQTALGHALRGTADQAGLGLELLSRLYFYWAYCGHVAAGRLWGELALSVVTEPSFHRARTQWLVAHTASITGDMVTAKAAAADALAWAEEHDDHEIAGHAYMAQCCVALITNDPQRTIELGRASSAAFALGGERRQAMISDAVVSIALAFTSQLTAATDLANSILAACAPMGEEWTKSAAYYALGLSQLFSGDYSASQQTAYEGLRNAKAFNNVVCARMHMDLLAWIASAAEDHRLAAQLLGVTHQLRPMVDTGSLQNSPTWTVHQTEFEQQTRRALGGPAFREEFEYGAANGKTLDMAISFIFDDRRRGLRQAAPTTQVTLTRRELQVAELIGRGLSNKEIAANLVISQRTAETHVGRILSKLGVTSRNQVSAWIAEHVR